MRYLITTNNGRPFFTFAFDPENHFNEDAGMVVYDLVLLKYMNNTRFWYDIAKDSL